MKHVQASTHISQPKNQTANEELYELNGKYEGLGLN